MQLRKTGCIHSNNNCVTGSDVADRMTVGCRLGLVTTPSYCSAGFQQKYAARAAGCAPPVEGTFSRCSKTNMHLQMDMNLTGLHEKKKKKTFGVPLSSHFNSNEREWLAFHP